PAFCSNDKCQREADEKIQEPDAKYSKDHGDQIARGDLAKAKAIYGQCRVARRNSNMAYVEMDTEDLAYKSSHTQEKAQGNVAHQRAGMLFHIHGQLFQSFALHGHPQYGMRLQSLGDTSILYLVLYIAGNDAADKKEDACVAGIEKRKALPGVL